MHESGGASAIGWCRRSKTWSPPNSCHLTPAQDGSNHPSASAFGPILLGCRVRRRHVIDDLVTVQLRTVVERDQSGDLGLAWSNECCGTYLDFGTTRCVARH